MKAIWWRMFYGLATGSVAQQITMLALRVHRFLRGADAVEGFLGLIERRYAFSGWPYYGRGWTNLHLSRFTTHVRSGLRTRCVAPSRRAAPQPITRIACLGGFVGLLGSPKELMARCPVELVVADMVFNDQHAGYLADEAASYAVFNLAVAGELERAAAFVNAAKPDLVLNIGHKTHAFELMDRLDAPCLANYCAGSDLLHHPRIDIQYHGQPEADYFVRGQRMFCGTTASEFGADRIQTITGYIDPRGLLGAARRSWSDREPLIVVHGSLYKCASPAFMATLWHWLRSDPALKLVLMGRDDNHSLAVLQQSAAAAGVGGQVEYRGRFSAVRDQDGDVSSSGWFDLVDLLGRARLAPNPFPLGGGSSRFEAYALGAPAPHLAVRFEPESWGRPQPSICEIPSMLVPRGTAKTIDEFRELGLRCLRDQVFADALAADQLTVARVITDADRWWREILDGYREWMQWRQAA